MRCCVRTASALLAALMFAACGSDGAEKRPEGETESPPSVPTGLSATAGVDSVVLRWTAVQGASSYELRRDEGCRGEFERIAAPTLATYTDTQVERGTEYCYVVVARNAAGTSEPSAEARATVEDPIGPDLPKGGLRATAGDGQVFLTWAPRADATGYTLTREPGGVALALSNTTTGVRIDGLSNGTEYTFHLQPSGDAKDDETVSATPARIAVEKVVAGSRTTCVLRVNGQVLCWGSDVAGQVGDGPAYSVRSHPSLVLENAVQVDVGGYGPCALLKSGEVMCWADSNSAQSPVKQDGFHDVVELAAGTFHMCARLSSGEVVCVGSGSRGQLGNGLSEDSTTPVLVKGLNDAVQLVSGAMHTCALRKGGELVCWGDNTDGQLGDGTTTNRAQPASVSGLAGAEQLAAGYSHTCARRADGEVYCWGQNKYAQLGDGTQTERFRPTLVKGMPNAVEVSAGLAHTCARQASGTVSCWGSNGAGALGSGTIVSTQATPIAVPGLSDVAQLSAGSNYACALRSSGEVLCWGDNQSGQLGDGRKTPQSYPVPLVGLQDVAQVVVGRDHGCARHANGGVSCWGSNSDGALGDGMSVSSPRSKVVGLSDAKSLAAGDLHSCAVRATGEAVCWGNGSLGRLGNTATSNAHMPVAVTGLTEVAELVLGRDHACARRTTGEVLCWGDNREGQLGDGTTMWRAKPTPVMGLSDAVQLTAGWSHTCARRSAGPVVCWGANGEGQLGDGTLSQRLLPTAVSGLSAAAELWSGGSETCARDAGQLLCWGASSKTPIPAPRTDLADAVQLALGPYDGTSCLRRGTGAVLCWGTDNGGLFGDGVHQLGLGPEQRTTVSDMIVGALDVEQVAIGTFHACVLRKDHTVDCWGGGDAHQIGQPHPWVPHPVLGL